MQPRRFGSWSSFADPNELSLTVVSLVQLLLSVAVGYGWISATGAQTTLTQIPVIVSAGVATWSAIQMLWGAARKVFYAIYPPVQ